MGVTGGNGNSSGCVRACWAEGPIFLVGLRCLRMNKCLILATYSWLVFCDVRFRLLHALYADVRVPKDCRELLNPADNQSRTQ